MERKEQMCIANILIIFFPTEYEPTLLGIQNLTEKFVKSLHKEDAPMVVLEMMNQGTFAIPNSDAIENNVTDFLNWWILDYFALIDKEIGWRKLDPSLWPGKAEAKMFIKRFVQFTPELCVEEDFGLYDSMWKRFYNSARKRKGKLGIPTGTRGKIQ